MEARPSPADQKSTSYKRWFWITLAVGAVPPAIVFVSWLLGGSEELGRSQNAVGVLATIAFLCLATLWPFFFLALIVRFELRNATKPGDLLRSKANMGGAIVGMSVPHVVFWALMANLPLHKGLEELFYILAACVVISPALMLITAPVGGLIGLAV